MSQLKIYKEDDPSQCRVFEGFEEITKALLGSAIKFERWNAKELNANAKPEEILQAFEDDVNRIKEERDFSTADVISLGPESENIEAVRAKFLQEHTHGEDEARFFVYGRGLFYIHLNGEVYALLCEKNDLINVPAKTKHWFDMGPKPDFKCIRFFTNPSGWVAEYTGSKIADDFPRFE